MLRKTPLFLLVALFMVLLTNRAAYGQNVAGTMLPIDVVIVLDDSGSMGTCWPWIGGVPPNPPTQCAADQNPPSDAANLRYSAARLLIQLADEGDRIAAISFASQIENLGSGQLERVGGSVNRQAMVAALQPPSSYQGRGLTRIDLGLARAAAILDARQGEDAKRPSYVLLLTDGSPQPDEPPGEPSQQQTIRKTMDVLRQRGVQVLPIALCDKTGNCPISTLSLMGRPRTAETADELLKEFSSIFAEMKPTLHVVSEPNSDGDVTFFTGPAHGLQQVNVIAPLNALAALLVGDVKQQTTAVLSDSNITVNTVEGTSLPSGKWVVKGSGAFVVARTATYPDLVFPPPAVPGSIAAPRYIPAGKTALLVGRIVGPAGAEPLNLNDAEMRDLSADRSLRWATLSEPNALFSLQVSNDNGPLQIKREFSVTPVGDNKLPQAQAPAPVCVPNVACKLEVVFAPGPEIQDLKGQIFIADKLNDGSTRPIYNQNMNCAERSCSDQGFTPLDGYIYEIRYLLEARASDMTFGDWAETTVIMKPAVYVRGLPDPLDLRTQPDGGWPVTVIAGTSSDLGKLRATLQLIAPATGNVVSGPTVLFSADIRGSGEQPATLRVTDLDSLPPGEYTGRLTFSVDNPQPGQEILLPTPIEVVYNVGKASATILNSEADFKEVQFQVTPNFRVDQQTAIRVHFDDQPFALAVIRGDQNCPDLTLSADSPQPLGEGNYQVDLHLRSTKALPPQTCQGSFSLQATPAENYDIKPGFSLQWRVSIRAIEARVQVAQVDFGTASPEARIDVTRDITVTYSGVAFPLSVEPVDPSSWCAGLQLTADPPQPQSNGSHILSLRLQSDQPLPAQVCKGKFQLTTAPAEHYDIQPYEPLNWQVEVMSIEWGYRGVANVAVPRNNIIFDSLRQVGDQAETTLLIRYTGSPPFSLDVTNNSIQDDQGNTINADEYLKWIVQPVMTKSDSDSVYHFPVTVQVLRDLPDNWLGAKYAGLIQIKAAGLASAVPATVSYSFHTPNWVEANIGPLFVLPLPGIVTCTLTSILLLLLLLAFMYVRVWGPNRSAAEVDERTFQLAHGTAGGRSSDRAALVEAAALGATGRAERQPAQARARGPRVAGAALRPVASRDGSPYRPQAGATSLRPSSTLPPRAGSSAPFRPSSGGSSSRPAGSTAPPVRPTGSNSSFRPVGGTTNPARPPNGGSSFQPSAGSSRPARPTGGGASAATRPTDNRSTFRPPGAPRRP